VHVERAACDAAEIGGHAISGHVDFTASVLEVQRTENNHKLRIAVPPPWMRYIFTKGYVAIDGASLTAAEAERRAGWFDVWLIPETLRVTTLGDKQPGHNLNIELDRAAQVIVDTLRDALEERLGPAVSLLETLLRERGLELGELALPALTGARR
jgi:riboflavin synthase